MLLKTEGIVLHTLKYSDNSLIVRFFTPEHGVVACMIKGIHGKKSGFKSVYFQPLNVLELNLDYHENKNLQMLKELKLMPVSYQIVGDIQKSSIAIFLAEVLFRSLKEGYVNSPLYELVRQAVDELSVTEKGLSSFPVKLMVLMSKELGFAPQNNYSTTNILFSIPEGAFVSTVDRPDPTFYFSLVSSKVLHEVLSGRVQVLTSAQRADTLAGLLQYFQYHLPGMGAIRSQQVLRDVFSD